jgi:ribosomal protein S18 acetylase RimI-like enzyme
VTISINDLEHAAAPGWRAAEEDRLGDWLLRAASGFTGRANSALAAGDPGRPLSDAIDAVRSWYAARGLPAMIAVPYPTGRPDDSALDRMLAALGWTIRADAATVMTAEPATVSGLARETDLPVDFKSEPDRAWLARYHYRGQDLPPVAVQLLTSAPWQAFASVRSDGDTIAIGRVAGSWDWAGLTAIEVAPEHRRQGLGRAVTAALAACAVARGAAGLFLQVADHNHGARALYRQLGFADHHGYHYRIAPRSSLLAPG